MSKNTVLITSALYSNYGVYTTKQRIQQTLDTAKSARKYIPNATLILVDNSKVDVQNDDSAEFNELLDLVDYYIDNSSDTDIQYFHNNVKNYDIGKNSMEALGMHKALSYIATDEEIKAKIDDSTRIFKLSGRYVVTDKFDIAQFDNTSTQNKYVFKRREASWIPQSDTGVDYLLQTRLYSFTPSLFNETVDLFKAIIDNMFNVYNQSKYIDVEHSMAKFISADKLVEIEQVGLMGNIAPNGMMIID
jgi:hypothetical protein